MGFFLTKVPQNSGGDELVNLRSGTPVILKIPETITSETAHLNQIIKLKVVEDVKVNDSVVIPTGADAHGKITKVTRPKSLGQKGELRMTVPTSFYERAIQLIQNLLEKNLLATLQRGSYLDESLSGIAASYSCSKSIAKAFVVFSTD